MKRRIVRSSLQRLEFSGDHIRALDAEYYKVPRIYVRRIEDYDFYS